MYMVSSKAADESRKTVATKTLRRGYDLRKTALQVPNRALGRRL